MKRHFKIGDLVFVDGSVDPERGLRRAAPLDVGLALILKVHTKADPEEIYYKLHFMEKNTEEWISGFYLQPTH